VDLESSKPSIGSFLHLIHFFCLLAHAHTHTHTYRAAARIEIRVLDQIRLIKEDGQE